MRAVLARWRARARQLKTEIYALYMAYQDSRTPWYARVFTICVVAYALSPIDLIPDFIPIIGYLDDVVLVPLGIALALKMIPAEVLAESRLRAQALLTADKPRTNWAAVVIVTIWALGAGLTVWVLIRVVLK